MLYKPTSAVLEGLIRDAPAGHVTMDWLLAHLRSRSFGILFLVLGDLRQHSQDQHVGRAGALAEEGCDVIVCRAMAAQA